MMMTLRYVMTFSEYIRHPDIVYISHIHRIFIATLV